jgi:hypothetical protein
MNKKINIFKSAKKIILTEEELENKAIEAIQEYLSIMKNNNEKISDFKQLIDHLFSEIRNKK